MRLRLIPSNDYNIEDGDVALKLACINSLENQDFKFIIQMKTIKKATISIETIVKPNNRCQSTIRDEDTNILKKTIQVESEGFRVEKVTSEFICVKRFSRLLCHLI